MPEALVSHEDVIVVGAGVLGLSIALELLRRGRHAVVLERSEPGSGASGAATGMLAPASEAGLEEPVLVELGLDSLRRYPEFIERVERISGLDCGYRDEGTLWLASNRDDEADLDRLMRRQRSAGLPAYRLTAAQVLEREPSVAPGVTAGLAAERDHQVDPRRLVRALTAAVRKSGGLVRRGCDVQRVEPDRRGMHRVTGAAGFAALCRTAVLTPGAWASTGLRSAASGLAVRPVKSHAVRLFGPELVRHVIRTPRAHLVPRRGGELVIGATMGEAGLDPAPAAGPVLELLRRGREVLPGIAELAVTELCAGFRPAAPDNLPVIDALEGGCFAAVGLRNGVLLAPATAHHLAEMIVTGGRPPALEPFTAARGSLRRATRVAAAGPAGSLGTAGTAGTPAESLGSPAGVGQGASRLPWSNAL